jgi:asparagine synthase (glutamine-hydrolysing)
MCGILFYLSSSSEVREKVFIEALKKLQHRGPDHMGHVTISQVLTQTRNDNITENRNENVSIESVSYSFGHTRLAIIDPESGKQPFDVDGLLLTVNGEIYNYRQLQELLLGSNPIPGISKVKFKTQSDCETILHLYRRYTPEELCNKLIGMFAFVLCDTRDNSFLIARDPVGINPLYIGYFNNEMWIASEVKALLHCDKVEEFPPGYYWHIKPNTYFERKFYPSENWWKSSYDLNSLYEEDLIISQIRQKLIHAVKSHMMSDVPYGVLLSGGLDSSIISTIVARNSIIENNQTETLGEIEQKITTFSIGLRRNDGTIESPDLMKAREMAQYLNSIHHEFTFTIDEAIEELSDVIWHIETFDTTTIRASTPMFLMAKKIKQTGIKMVLSGEGSDEIFGGYLYFSKAPNSKELYEETIRKVRGLSQYDCLRANKSLMAFGIEGRVPFLDTKFLDFAMKIPPELKMSNNRIEKYILRKAFSNFLPESICWRQKEQFSDGVGYNWIDSIKKYAQDKWIEERVSQGLTLNFNIDEIAKKYPQSTPRTTEEYLYRKIFDQLFTSKCASLVPWGPSIACSSPTAIKWDTSFSARADPSGRSLSHHASSK